MLELFGMKPADLAQEMACENLILEDYRRLALLGAGHRHYGVACASINWQPV